MQTIYTGQGTLTIPISLFDSSGAPYSPDILPDVKVYLGATEVSSGFMAAAYGLPNVFTYDLSTTNLAAGNYVIIFHYQDGATTDIYQSDTLQIASLGWVGAGGSKNHIITLEDDYTGDPLEGRTVWLSTSSVDGGISGIQTVRKSTNSFGRASFDVEPGVYYLFSDIQASYISVETVS